MTDMPTHSVRKLAVGDCKIFRELLTVFGEAFEDTATYAGAQPSDDYLDELLGGDGFFALVVVQANCVIGGLVAYELKKFERERSEIYIYDLAVAAEYRRRGFATELIEELKKIAAARGAYVIFVQAETDDPPAIALYTKLGTREDVLHFDIDVI